MKCFDLKPYLRAFTKAGFLVGLGLVAGFASPASAQEERNLLGSFRYWDALIINGDNGDKTCYMISTPQTTLPRGANRGNIYTTITIRPRMHIEDEVNVVVGYPFRAGSDARTSIGNRRFNLFTEGDGAWLRTPEDDSAMVAAMRAGNQMVVRGTSSRGTDTTDTYSLIGFTAAHNAIKEACS